MSPLSKVAPSTAEPTDLLALGIPDEYCISVVQLIISVLDNSLQLNVTIIIESIIIIIMIIITILFN